MSVVDEEVNPYELLGVTLESAEGEIRTAYRQRSLKVHPDRNRGNPDAARKFHELNQAYELLLDPLRRMALDAKLRIKEARKTRFAKYDAKRKGLVDELEERERALKKARTEKMEKDKELSRENERIMEEGRLMRERIEADLRRRELEREQSERRSREKEADGLEPPSLGTLDTTVRLKYSLASYPNLTTPESLSALLASFGATDTSDIVISLKPPPPKKSKRGTALVPFKQIGDAFGAVCASGREELGLKDIEVSWGEGKEPELIGWLKKMGHLGSTGAQNIPTATSDLKPLPSEQHARSPPQSDSSPFSSFPSTFPDLPAASPPSSTPTAPGLDYESLTMMRLRQAERERLEREIREQEAREES